MWSLLTDRKNDELKIQSFKVLNTIEVINYLKNYPIIIYRFITHLHINDSMLFYNNFKQNLYSYWVLLIMYLVIFILIFSYLLRRYTKKQFLFLFFIYCIFTTMFFYVFSLSTDNLEVYISLSVKNIFDLIFNQTLTSINYSAVEFLDNAIQIANFKKTNKTNYFITQNYTINIIFNKKSNKITLLMLSAVFLTIALVYKNEAPAYVKHQYYKINTWSLLLLVFYIFILTILPANLISFLICEAITLTVAVLVFKNNNINKFIKSYFKMHKNNRYLLYIITLIIDVETMLFGYNTFVYKFIFTACSIIWIFNIFNFITSLQLQHIPTSIFTFNGLTKFIISINYIILINPDPVIFSYMFSFFLLFFYFRKSSEAMLSAPTRAFERNKKITMFEEAEEAKTPKHIIGWLQYNTNANFITICGTDLLLIFTIYIGASTNNIDIKYYLIFVLTSCFLINWIGIFSSMLITEATKSADIRDWRGLYLAFHSFIWPVKYTIILILFACLSLIVCSLMLSYLTFCGSIKCFFNVLLINFLTIYFLFIIERFWTLWVSIVTYFQRYDYEYWDDNFWLYLAPHLRDIVYWTPIRPDDYVPKRPYYLGLRFKITSKLITGSFFILGIITLLLKKKLFTIVYLHFLFFFLWYLVIFSTLKFFFNFFRPTKYTGTDNIENYIRLAFWSELASAFLAGLLMYYLIDNYDYGLLVVVLFFYHSYQRNN